MMGAFACVLAMPMRGEAQEAKDAKDAKPDVAAANRAVLSQLPFEDRQDFEDVTRGFIATVPYPQNQAYAFVINGSAPDTVNPSHRLGGRAAFAEASAPLPMPHRETVQAHVGIPRGLGGGHRD